MLLVSFLGEFLKDKCGNANTLVPAALQSATARKSAVRTSAVASGEASVLGPHSLSSAGDAVLSDQGSTRDLI